MPNLSFIQTLWLGADAIQLSRRDPPRFPLLANMTGKLRSFEEINASFEGLSSYPSHGEQDHRLEAVSCITSSKETENSAIESLHSTIPHPPDTYLGPEYTFRHADGGFNNIQKPNLGRAGTTYARRVQPKKTVASSSLPDPGLIFDTLLRARDRKNHPGGNSSLAFAFASVVNHTLFRTNPLNPTINETSSYLDLSPLYGHNQQTQDSVRDRSSGRGFIWPDTFAEERFIFLPPATSALLVLFNRNHQYIADMLLKINEKKRWTDPPPTEQKARAQQDEEIFQTAKLINCGHFMGIVMRDYVSGFLGLSEGNSWNLDVFDPIKLWDGTVISRGDGNHVSIEFNLLYRWHTTSSAVDEKQAGELFARMSDHKPVDEISSPDFGVSILQLRKEANLDPKLRTFAGLKRGLDGKFSDDDIANIFHDATENPGGQFGARGTPGVMRALEIMGIEQSRQWGVCTMNEFRKFLRLKQFQTFEEWNPDPEIAGSARRLYHHIDNLELYAGLQCEATMPLSDGLRFACGYTMTQAILGDAIALVRGDRFYTIDFTPATLTSWGFQDCERDPHNGSSGSGMPKLLMRHLPLHYPLNNVYGIFPFFTPKKMKESLTRQGIADQYTFNLPIATPVPKVLSTFTAIKHVFSDHKRFKPIYELNGLGQGYGIVLSHEKDQHNADRALLLHALFPTRDSLSEYADWYRDMTIKGIKTKSWKYDGVPDTYVDIVDVINTAAIHWAADKLCGIPLETQENPRGLFAVQELYNMFATLFTASFLSVSDSEGGFSLRRKALKSAITIQAMITKSILEVAPESATNVLVSSLSEIITYFWPPSEKPCHEFLRRLAETGRPAHELVASVVSLANGTTVNQAQAAVHVVDFYLDDEREKERIHILQLVQKHDARSDELLCGYVREAMRLNPQFTGLWRGAEVDAEIPQGDGRPPMQVKKGDRIWASFKKAHLNPQEFPDPETVNPERPKSLYNLNGTGYHSCPGVSYAERTIAEILKVVFSLKDVRRAAGDAGRLVGITQVVNEAELKAYIQPNGTLSHWPTSMHLVYVD